MDTIVQIGALWFTLGGIFWFGFVALGFRFADRRRSWLERPGVAVVRAPSQR